MSKIRNVLITLETMSILQIMEWKYVLLVCRGTVKINKEICRHQAIERQTNLLHR